MERYTVMVCTVGGEDRDGNEVDEPVVFDGSYNEALEFFDNNENLCMIDDLFESMPDGYILIDSDRRGSRQVYDVDDIMEAIWEMS